MKKVYTSIDQIIGNTPLLELTHIERELELDARIFAKLEYLNPAGSIKDRIAKGMIEAAEATGELKKGSVIIEPTSGNMGIGLASVATAKGYRVIIVMPDSMSVERRKLIQGYGAELVLTDGAKGMKGAIEKAKELAKEMKDSYIPAQFDNPENTRIHLRTTGPEIYEALDGDIDIVISGVGTGGTITGIGKYLKSQRNSIQVIAVEPADSPILSGGEVGAHMIQGIGTEFVPEVLNTLVYDEIIVVKDEDALECSWLIGKKEGILVGISSGAVLQAAIVLARREENKGKNMVVIFSDSGDRYLSTPMFA